MGTKVTANGYWRELCETNPGLLHSTSRMTLSVAEFRKSIRKAFDAGRRSNDDVDFGRILGDLLQPKP